MPVKAKPAPILVKRYPQGRLYDTAGLRYVTLDDLRQWLVEDTAFVARDVGSGQDVTEAVLAQIRNVVAAS